MNYKNLLLYSVLVIAILIITGLIAFRPSKTAIPETASVQPAVTVPDGGCYVSGCSQEICSDQKDAISACIYRSDYMCYKSATCERQTDGECGWTQTSALAACIQENAPTGSNFK